MTSSNGNFQKIAILVGSKDNRKTIRLSIWTMGRKCRGRRGEAMLLQTGFLTKTGLKVHFRHMVPLTNQLDSG